MTVDINPIFVELGPVTIYWYGIFMALTVITAYLASRHLALHYGISEKILDDVMIKLAVVAFIGARLGVVLTNLSYYLQHPMQILSPAGLGSHGAIGAVMLIGWFVTRRAGIRYWTLADAGAICLPIGHVFIRLGNFMNAELYGTASDLPWAIDFPTTPGPVHPVQLYEAGFALLFLPLAWRWAKSPAYPGQAFFRIVLVHSVVRLLLDSIRQHTDPMGPFVLTQWVALGLAALCIFMMYYQSKKASSL